MIKQRTIKSITQAAGVGLHTGQKVYMTLRPAQPDTGIVFCRNDLPAPITLKADAFKVGDTRLSTCLEGNGVKVSTIEHLMSALAGLGIDNLYIDLTATEVPIVDGSAGPFVFLLQAAGIEEQAVAKRYVRVRKAVEVRDGDKWVRLEPHHGFKLTYTIAYNHPVFANVPDSLTVDFADTSYVNQVSRARTFGFMQEVEALLAQGLAQGGSLDNAIVMDEYRVINDDGLRYRDEFVRHKILDAIGDLYLLGHPLIGAFHGYKSGHALNNALLRALLADEQAWEFVTFEAPETVPAAFLAPRLEAA